MNEAFIRSITIALAFKAHLQLCHWGVRGMFFYQYHELFAKLYGLIDQDIDTLAEQANIRGVFLNAFVFTTPLPLKSSDPIDMINSSLVQVDAYKESLKVLCSEAQESLGTVNIVEGIISTVDTVQYLLEASMPRQ